MNCRAAADHAVALAKQSHEAAALVLANERIAELRGALASCVFAETEANAVLARCLSTADRNHHLRVTGILCTSIARSMETMNSTHTNGA